MEEEEEEGLEGSNGEGAALDVGLGFDVGNDAGEDGVVEEVANEWEGREEGEAVEPLSGRHAGSRPAERRREEGKGVEEETIGRTPTTALIDAIGGRIRAAYTEGHRIRAQQ